MTLSQYQGLAHAIACNEKALDCVEDDILKLLKRRASVKERLRHLYALRRDENAKQNKHQ